MTIILDPGHGMANRSAGRFDPGAVSEGIREADIVLAWANELRSILRASGHKVVRTRIDHRDPAPVGQRAAIARQYGGEIMLSLHCNAANGKASGTETFYRGVKHKGTAAEITTATCGALGIPNRGAKTESQSQHGSLAVMSFQPTFLLELGFIDHPGDRAAMLDTLRRKAACEALATLLQHAVAHIRP